jgi:hypothetical protein
VYKLHGSVNWLVDPQGAIGVAPPLEILERDLLPVIVRSPRQGRRRSFTRTGHSLRSGRTPSKANAEADTVVFVGYRFPPSDSEARGRLLSAIGGAAQPHIKVHTVLGPRTSEDDSVRLQALLESTLRALRSSVDEPRPKKSNLKFHVEVHPLYTQDFLSVLYPGMLDESNIDMFEADDVVVRPA